MYDSIEDFLRGEKEPEKYDFSNDGASDAYINLTDKEIFKKFFTYMCTPNPFEKQEENDLFIEGKKYREEYIRKYGAVVDPDSESVLLQKIYCKLWGISDITQPCISIQGETLNSVNKTLDTIYGFIEQNNIELSDQLEERIRMRTKGKGFQGISIKYLLCRYFENPNKMTDCLSKIEGLKKFLSVYHSLGNFMPVPSGCNGPRGVGKLKDYWDLTLWRIYEYYIDENDRIYEIVGKKSLNYKKWLDTFFNKKCNDAKTKGISAWKNFIEQNYLRAYVEIDKGGVPIPTELWEGHFNRDENNNFIHILPKNCKQCEQYFINAYNCIITRGEDLVKALK